MERWRERWRETERDVEFTVVVNVVVASTSVLGILMSPSHVVVVADSPRLALTLHDAFGLSPPTPLPSTQCSVSQA